MNRSVVRLVEICVEKQSAAKENENAKERIVDEEDSRPIRQSRYFRASTNRSPSAPLEATTSRRGPNIDRAIEAKAVHC